MPKLLIEFHCDNQDTLACVNHKIGIMNSCNSHCSSPVSGSTKWCLPSVKPFVVFINFSDAAIPGRRFLFENKLCILQVFSDDIYKSEYDLGKHRFNNREFLMFRAQFFKIEFWCKNLSHDPTLTVVEFVPEGNSS